MVSSLAEFTWRKSSRSNGTGACVEIAHTPTVVAVRDSKNPEAGTLVPTPTAWAAFHTVVRA